MYMCKCKVKRFEKHLTKNTLFDSNKLYLYYLKIPNTVSKQYKFNLKVFFT